MLLKREKKKEKKARKSHSIQKQTNKHINIHFIVSNGQHKLAYF